ncbi:MAG: glucose-1-phosphate adenylyltransferase [Planctomycetaceae bacterium]|jgi:glucose-1-phosphate adenylyltransferase|nr:glucose-1-phosphate adenylyltransferase [Planctomycetaceae bacterium]
MKNHIFAVVLAGGKGARLEPLTRDRAKPAVPFGGGYRIIDFTLSNCLNSNIRQMLLLTQYKAISLDRHIAMGWNRYFCREMGEFVDVVPPQQRIAENWYQGTADAVYQNIYSIEKEQPDHVIILAGDHIYKMNYRKMIDAHIESHADLTIGVIPVSIERARRQFGVMEIDSNQRVIGFEEKPEDPKPIPGNNNICMASMGIYVFKSQFLFEQLCRDATRRGSRHDFGCDIIPSVIDSHRIYAFPFMDENRKTEAYWRDVGTLDAYYDANMDLVGVDPLLNLYDENWPISTYHPNYPPAKFVFNEEHRTGHAIDSIVCPGTIFSGGEARHSIIGNLVRVNSYASIEDSIIFSRVNIGRNVKIRRAIIDKGVSIPSGMEIGFDHDLDRSRGFTITENGVTVIAKNERRHFITGNAVHENYSASEKEILVGL